MYGPDIVVAKVLIECPGPLLCGFNIEIGNADLRARTIMSVLLARYGKGLAWQPCSPAISKHFHKRFPDTTGAASDVGCLCCLCHAIHNSRVKVEMQLASAKANGQTRFRVLFALCLQLFEDGRNHKASYCVSPAT